MARQYYNNYSKSYKLDPWTTDDIKYFDKIKDIFKSRVTVEKFDSKKYVLNLVKIPSTGWFDYDGEISTINKELFEFWQDFAIAVEVIDRHEENIERGIYTKEEIKEYREKMKCIFFMNENFDTFIEYSKILPEYNIYFYVVNGKDKYGSKIEKILIDYKDAINCVNKLEKAKIYSVNYFELHKVTIGLRRLEYTAICEIKINE